MDYKSHKLLNVVYNNKVSPKLKTDQHLEAFLNLNQKP